MAKKVVKKSAPVKAVKKASVNPVAKKAIKKAAPKVAAKPIKKSAPAPKKAVKPVAKKAAPAPKKAVKPAAKKAAPAPKKAVKPVAKKAAPAPKKAAKPVVKKAVPVAKKLAKPVAKKAAPAPKKAVKQVAKKAAPAPKKAVKPLAKKAATAPVKKVEVKKVAPAPKKAAKKASPAAVTAVVVNVKPKIKAKETISPNAKIEAPVPLANASNTSMRYSDKDLAEFEALIKVKLEQAKSDLDELKLSLSHEGDNSTDDTSPTFKMMEDGNDTTSREEVAQLAARQGKFILSLENALLRIKNKTYGICRVTGKLIPKERLKLVPHATLSIEAKNMQ